MASSIDEKIRHLSRCVTFRDLGAGVIRKVAELSDEIEKPAGEHLYLQGEDASYFYLLISGRVELTGNEVMTGQDVSSILGAGSLVGYSSHLLAQESPRQNKTARVAEKTRLLKIGEQAIEVIKKKKPLVYREHCSVALREMLSSAPQTEVIKHLRSEVEVLSGAKISVLVSGERVFEEGDLSDDVFFILGGSVKIVKKAYGGQEEMVARLRPGQVFGEVGLEAESFRQASVESEGVSTLLRVKRDIFKKLMSRNEDLELIVHRQSDLYSSQDTSGLVSRMFRNMSITSRVSMMACASMMAIAATWYGMGSSVLESNFSTRLMRENTEHLSEAHAKLASYYNAFGAQEIEFIKAVKEISRKGDPVSTGAHRKLDIYLFNGKGYPLMSVPKFIEDRVIDDVDKIFSGGLVDPGYQVASMGDYSAYYRVTPVRSEANKIVGVVASVFDPADILDDPRVVIAVPGQEPMLGGFRGRERDLDRRPDDFLQVGPTVYSVTRSKIESDELAFNVYSWIDVSKAIEEEKDLRTKVLLVIFIGIAASVSIIHLLTKLALSPLTDLSHSVRRLTEGQRSIPIPYADRTNEFGYLARDFAILQDTMQQSEVVVAERIVEQQRKLQRQEEVKVAIERFREVFDDYVGEFHQSVETFTTVSGQLLERSTAASESTDKISSAFNDTKRSIEKVEEMAFKLKDAIKIIEQRTGSSKEALERAVADAEMASRSNDKLEKSVEDVESILAVIKGIAEKTRLLSLNATIEASKAGPSGKGFFVVAQEVRNLAIQTSDALQSIHKMVTDIEENSGDVGVALSKITSSIADLKEEQNGIAEAVQLQSKATHKIALDVNKASGQTKKVSESMDNISGLVGSSEEVSEEVNASATILKETSGVFEEKIASFLRKIGE